MKNSNIKNDIERMTFAEVRELEEAIVERKQKLWEINNLLQPEKTYMVVFNPNAREPDSAWVEDDLSAEDVKAKLKDYGCEFDLYEAKKLASGEDHAITELK